MAKKTSKPVPKRTPGRRHLGTASRSEQQPCMKHAGKLKPLHKETQRINKRIEEAFENINLEAWGPTN